MVINMASYATARLRALEVSTLSLLNSCTQLDSLHELLEDYRDLGELTIQVSCLSRIYKTFTSRRQYFIRRLRTTRLTYTYRYGGRNHARGTQLGAAALKHFSVC